MRTTLADIVETVKRLNTRLLAAIFPPVLVGFFLLCVENNSEVLQPGLPEFVRNAAKSPDVPKSKSGKNSADPQEIVFGWVGVNAGDYKQVSIGDQQIIFRWCPPGKFIMGSPVNEVCREWDEDQAEVKITRGFWLMMTEVTQGLYQSVTGTNPSKFKGSPLLPVEKVSWVDANRFCDKLNDLLQKELAAGYRITLPTEAQWEYAARAGTTKAYSFGNEINSNQANFNGTSRFGNKVLEPNLQKTTEVRSYPRNAWWLYDMHGNVFEWVSDWYEPNPLAGDDPTGPASGVMRVIRGGSWVNGADGCRSAFRRKAASGDVIEYLGFRLAVSQSK